MPDPQNNNLQIVSGVLIVLSIVLLYCWWVKKCNNDCNKSYMRGSPLYTQGPMYGQPVDWNKLSHKEGMLNFGELGKFDSVVDVMNKMPKVESMQDMTNNMTNRHYKMNTYDVVNHRWSSDANVAEPLIGSGRTGENDNLVLGSDIITPSKPVLDHHDRSLSADQILMTDYTSQWGTNQMPTNVSI